MKIVILLWSSLPMITYTENKKQIDQCNNDGEEVASTDEHMRLTPLNQFALDIGKLLCAVFISVFTTLLWLFIINLFGYNNKLFSYNNKNKTPETNKKMDINQHENGNADMAKLHELIYNPLYSNHILPQKIEEYDQRDIDFYDYEDY